MSETTYKIEKEDVQRFLNDLAVILNRMPKQEGMSILVQIVVDTAQYTFGTSKEDFLKYIEELWEASKNPNCVELEAKVYGTDGVN